MCSHHSQIHASSSFTAPAPFFLSIYIRDRSEETCIARHKHCILHETSTLSTQERLILQLVYNYMYRNAHHIFNKVEELN